MDDASDLTILMRHCERLARVRPPWWEPDRRPAIGTDTRGRPIDDYRTVLGHRLSFNLFVRTMTADGGAMQAAHHADCARIGDMARLLAADWLPARAVAYLDDLDSLENRT